MANYVAFCVFVAVMTGTPGPGNLSMMAIGQSRGFRGALPFLLGTTVGCGLLNTLVACGLGQLFLLSATAVTVLRVVGLCYIVYLAMKIVCMSLDVTVTARRFSFAEGVALHPLSPKTWAMSVTAFSQFTDPSSPLAAKAVVFVLTFMAGQVLFHSLWGLAGASLLRLAPRRAVQLGLNAAMALLMVGATVYAMAA